MRVFDSGEGWVNFEECVAPFLEAGPAGAMSAMYAIRGFRLACYPTGFDASELVSGVRQLTALLRGGVDIVLQSGVTRRLAMGQVVLAEERENGGNRLRATSAEQALLLIAPLVSQRESQAGLGPEDAI